MNEEFLTTQEGYDKVVAEHEYLVSEKRKEVAAKLKEAKSYGDLSENAEYDAAKELQQEVEERIAKLEALMRNAKIISDAEINEDQVNLGLTVQIKDLKTKEEFTYTIVGANQADPFEGRISNECPVGKALLGHKVGDKIEIELENGNILNYQIKKITKE